MSSAVDALLAAGVSQEAILFFDGTEIISNGVAYNLQHPTGMTNLAGYTCWGGHSSLENMFPFNKVEWRGNSDWWIINTIESFNGQPYAGQSDFFMWFSSTAFGGTNYSNTPVGAVTHVDEPFTAINNGPTYFGLWGSGRSFAICAWNCRRTDRFQAVGDPLVRR